MFVKQSAQHLIHEEQSVHNNHREDNFRNEYNQCPGRAQNLNLMAQEISMKGLLSGQGEKTKYGC